MNSIAIGKDAGTGADVVLPLDSFKTHYHLIGGTGKGKTTAIHTMLQPMLLNRLDKSCYVIIDKLGNFSEELLLWMSSRYCTQRVRDRLVFIRAANEDVVSPINPFIYRTPAEGYYKVERATEIILRAWESQSIEAMPRLARWTFNAFWAAAQLGLTISDCVHFLIPGSEFHERLMEVLPPGLKAEWREITSNDRKATEILDSSRNRLRPYFTSDILRRMFGSNTSRLDVLRMMKEGKILMVDLSPHGKVGDHLSSTIGSLLINEIIATVRTLPPGVRFPTYLFLDEFQNFVGPDVESALPELRNLGLRMILSHQSLSQLKRGEYDMTNIIFQAQSRMIFGVQGEDADLLADELGSLTFDPYKIKAELYSRKQRQKGLRIAELVGWSEAEQESQNWTKTVGKGWNHSEGRRGDPFALETWDNLQRSTGQSGNENQSDGRSSGISRTKSKHQTLVPELEDFTELMNRTYFGFDEHKQLWARDVRRLNRGQAFLRLVDDPRIHTVNVTKSSIGYLNFDMETIVQHLPRQIEAKEKMLEENFRSDFFVSAEEIDREAHERIKRVVTGRIILPANTQFIDATTVPVPKIENSGLM